MANRVEWRSLRRSSRKPPKTAENEPLDGWLRWFRRYEKHAPWAFCWRITLEGLAIAVVLAGIVRLCEFVLTFVGYQDELSARQLAEIRALNEMPTLLYFTFFYFSGVIVAPLLETWLFQTIPIYFVRRFGGSIKTQILVSALLFAAAHFTNRVGSGVAAGIRGGIYYGFMYVYWQRKSETMAYGLTALSHAIHNFLTITVLLAIKSFGTIELPI